MKTILSIIIMLGTLLPAAALRIECTAGQLEKLVPDSPPADGILTLTGTADARDFETLRCLEGFSMLDLTELEILPYFSEDPLYLNQTYFPANTIPPYAFFGLECPGLRLPASLKEIGEGALAGATIREIEIPEGVTYLYEYAFYGCENLKEVRLPESMHSLGKGCFAACPSLKNLNLGATSIRDIPERCFENDILLTSLDLSSIRNVGKFAFSGSGIREADLHSASRLDEYALANMPRIKSVCLNPLTRIHEGLLMQNPLLTEIRDTPANLPELFAANCGSLMPGDLVGNAASLKDFAFANTGGSEIVLGGRLTHIAAGVFSGCRDIRLVTATSLNGRIPTTDEDAFGDLDTSRIALHVSPESAEEWRAHPVWGNFNIVTNRPDSVEEIPADPAARISIIFSNGIIRILSAAEIAGAAVYDTEGRIILNIPAAGSCLEISTESLPAGLLIIAAGDTEGNRGTLKILN